MAATKNFGVKGIQVCSNEGLCPFTRGDNYDIAKYIDEIKKNLRRKNPWLERIQVCSNEGPYSFPREDN